jgi:hypothetical protein
LDDKYKEKKQENNSSFFDHSRASLQSEQKLSQNRGSLTSGGKAHTVSEKMQIIFNAPTDQDASYIQDSAELDQSQKQKLNSLAPRAIQYEVQENWQNNDDGSAGESVEKVNILVDSE